MLILVQMKTEPSQGSLLLNGKHVFISMVSHRELPSCIDLTFSKQVLQELLGPRIMKGLQLMRGRKGLVLLTGRDPLLNARHMEDFKALVTTYVRRAVFHKECSTYYSLSQTLDFIMGFSGSDPPFENMAELLVQFVSGSFGNIEIERQTKHVEGGHVAYNLLQAFYGAEYFHSATGIVLVSMVENLIRTTEYRMGCKQHRPWGLPMPHCGFACGAHGVSMDVLPKEVVRFRCSCGALTQPISQPQSITHTPLRFCPGMYIIPYPPRGDMLLTWTRENELKTVSWNRVI